mgnify:FL=1
MKVILAERQHVSDHAAITVCKLLLGYYVITMAGLLVPIVVKFMICH